MSDLALLADAARAAGAMMLSMRGRVRVSGKPDGSPVTDADLAVDAMLRERLTAARPDYGWLSEETADDASRLGRRRVFVVDPIDGTTAYIRGKPWFCTSLAVVDDGRPVVAAVFAPEQDELFLAAAAGGVTLNGAAVSGSTACDLAAARVVGDPDLLRPPAWPPFVVERRKSSMAPLSSWVRSRSSTLSQKVSCRWWPAAGSTRRSRRRPSGSGTSRRVRCWPPRRAPPSPTRRAGPCASTRPRRRRPGLSPARRRSCR